MCTYFIARLWIISLFFIIIACNVNNGRTNSKKVSVNDTLKVEGCQAAIKMELGSLVELKLKSTPGSGYQWLPADSSQLLQQLGADSLKFTKPATDKPKPGEPGHQILHFKAVKKGEEKIRFIYKRKWEIDILDSCIIKLEII